MAVGLVFDGVGVIEAQYRQVLQQVMPGGQLAPGLIAHAAGPTEDGFCVTEIWESQEALQRVVEDRLGQALQQANIIVQPKVFQIVNTMP